MGEFRGDSKDLVEFLLLSLTRSLGPFGGGMRPAGTGDDGEHSGILVVVHVCASFLWQNNAKQNGKQ